MLPLRIRSKIRFLHPTEPGMTACWIWTGHITTGGYGQTSSGSATVSAHRYVYEKLRGPLAAGVTLWPRCRRDDCVNPNHRVAVANIKTAA